jgi:lipoprotein NlpD
MRMKQTRPLVLLILSLGLLSACSTTTRKAPVIDRTPSAASRQAPAPAEESKEDARGTYTVKKGDTLLRIALDHGQNYRDVVAWNNLANPNDIKVDQVLRVAPPEHVAVQTSPVSMPEIRPSTPAVPKKSAPRGEKRPYSEAALAELKKEEGRADKDEPKAERPVVVAAAPSVAPGSVVRADDDEKLSWMWPSEGKVIATFDEG